MELHLRLRRQTGDLLPLNYQYALSSWIYKVISHADQDYSKFLHEKGFETGGRNFKLFTFSQLDTRPYKIVGNQIKLLGQEVSLFLRFAVHSSLGNFITGLFMQQNVGLGDKNSVVDFEVIGVETIAPPLFRPTMRYRCLSPLCVSRMRDDHTTEYLSPEAAGYGKLLVQNLVRKSFSLASTSDHTTPLLPEFQFRLLNTPRKKGIHIKANTASHTQLVGFLFHFELTAPVELHELGYEAGFGEKNSMGFGCVEML